MALVAKRNHQLAPARNEKGQISIFFSASLVVFVSIIAFVINVGLFVKAKINLQNATDAAAWSGAAVQSRQLTKIAYLNWEMRNIYKEWMYKYYVIGSLNTPGVEDTSKTVTCDGGSCSDFRLAPDENAITGSVTKDDYNFPAVCIHIAGSKTNICKRFAVPGLPEFGGYNIPGTEEASRAFIDGLIGSKVDDCVTRSQLNMLVASTWAYNVLPVDGASNTLAGRGPAIMNDRQGAWPRAVELAMRIRNLEKIMNRPTVDKAVCIGGIGNCDPVDKYASEPVMGNERIVKAFYSGYRNLGNHIDSEMKDSFALTELPPKKVATGNQYSNSNLLIPEPYEKQYVDLKLMMVNYATFYAALIPRADKGGSAACSISKVAIPVPGYPMGYYKNPDVVTYYAVKGEADFEGMFNPFADDSIKLTAYAAAKPMGGRIGPMLFAQSSAEQAIRPRQDAGKLRSVPYISTLDVVGTLNPYMQPTGKVEPGQFGPGVPLPINLGSLPFWITQADSPVGGLATGDEVQFGIPNLVYDFLGDMNPNSYTSNGEQLFKIEPKKSDASVKPIGLYNPDMFAKFRGNLSGVVTPDMLADQISRVRAPTQYEAANYLIPTPNHINMELGIDSFGIIPGQGEAANNVNGLKKYTAEIYAPLHRGNANHQDVLYASASDVLTNVMNFMRTQKSAMDNYRRSLNQAAIQTWKTGTADASEAAGGAAVMYKQAAERISDIGLTDANINDAEYFKEAKPKTCDSLAGQFLYFYYGHGDLFPDIVENPGDSCPVPLAELLQSYFANPDSTPVNYKMEYNLHDENFADKTRIYSAYVPGPYNGVGLDGKLIPPSGFPNQQEVMKRNFYSTKLVTLGSLRSGGGYDEVNTRFSIYSEGDISSSQATKDRAQETFANPLEADAIAPDLSSVKY